MKLNGHELEPIYISQIVELSRANNTPRITDFLWVGRFKKKLRKRLEQLERDYDRGLIQDRSYAIWKQMIKEVL